MNLSLEQKIYMGFGLALLILLAVGFFSYWSITQIIETDKKYEQANKVSFALATIASHLKDVDIASRSYLMTGHENDLEAYAAALQLIEQDIKGLYDLPEVDVYSQERLSKLESPIRRKLGIIAHYMSLSQTRELTAVLRLRSNDDDEASMDDILQVINRIQQEEQILLEERWMAQEVSIQQATLIVGGGSLIAVIILIIGIFVIIHDLKQRRCLEVTLQERESFLRAIVENVVDGLITIDQQGRIQFFNPAAERIFGYTANEVLGQNVNILMPAPYHEEHDGYLTSYLTTGQARVIGFGREVLGRRKDGTTFPLELNVSEMQIDRQLTFIGMARDITERIRVREALEQAKEAAESSARVKAEFLANMSHEIRTPLNAVIGMTSLLLDTSLSSEQQEFAETIRTSGDALLTIINDILDFSKIEAGKLELEKHPFDLRHCIEESLDLVALKAAEKKLDLAYLVDEATPDTLRGDVTRLRQIFVNLLNNAVKFTDRGEVVLSVKSQPLEPGLAGDQINRNGNIDPPPSYELHFIVHDTGIGIPADRMHRIFQSFDQVDTSTTRKYGGTGLGLTISKRLSEMMGGQLWAESAGISGQGSDFHFILQAEAVPGQSQGYLHQQQPELSGKHLLIVDDNATTRQILSRQTQTWGMQPHAAVSAEEALSWISRGDPFDLAILDMHLPGMDGQALAAKIRQFRSPQNLPLVMLTSLGQLGHNTQTSPVQFAAFLTKPIKPFPLHNILRRIFGDQPIEIKSEAAPPLLDSELGRRHPLRILLAEDNAVNQKVALHLLGRMGYRADVAANGLEVLQALYRQMYDVILMDMQMPEMDGLEATRYIRAQWPAEGGPWIIAMTASALQGDQERCIEAGMNDYVSKPIRPEELAQALSRCQIDAGPNGTKSVVPAINLRSEHENSTSINHDTSPLEAGVLAELYELLGNQASQMLAELIDVYFETAPSLLQTMRTALQHEDGPTLYRAAHTLKPGSAQLGATQLATLCAELEIIAKAGQFEEAASNLAKLEAEFSRVQIALQIEKERASA